MTLWYGVAIAVCIVAYSLAVGYGFGRHVEAEIDRRVHEDIELAARALVFNEARGLEWAGGFLGKQIDEEEGGGHWIEVWDDAGVRVLTEGTMPEPPLGALEISAASHRGHTQITAMGPLRVMTDELRMGGRTYRIRAAVSEIGYRAQLRAMRFELALVSLTVLFFGGLGGILIARRALGPLVRLAARARLITADQIHELLPEESSSAEVEDLRMAINETLARLNRAFQQLGRFSGDASHELRTPLTALRAVGEASLRKPRTAEEYREVIGSMLEEVDRLTRLSDDLLTLARAETGRAHLHVESVDLAVLAREVASHLLVLAEERGQTVEVQAESPVTVEGDRAALRQALVNLLDNAIKYSPPESRIIVAAGFEGPSAFLRVVDDGPGIPAADQPRVFERFFRADRQRSREMGGTGLGLSIVKLVAETHGGTVSLASESGHGCTFTVRLPRPIPHLGG
jgi:heavy metal sensor kinase